MFLVTVIGFICTVYKFGTWILVFWTDVSVLVTELSGFTTLWFLTNGHEMQETSWFTDFAVIYYEICYTDIYDVLITVIMYMISTHIYIHKKQRFVTVKPFVT